VRGVEGVERFFWEGAVKEAWRERAGEAAEV